MFLYTLSFSGQVNTEPCLPDNKQDAAGETRADWFPSITARWARNPLLSCISKDLSRPTGELWEPGAEPSLDRIGGGHVRSPSTPLRTPTHVRSPTFGPSVGKREKRGRALWGPSWRSVLTGGRTGVKRLDVSGGGWRALLPPTRSQDSSFPGTAQAFPSPSVVAAASFSCHSSFYYKSNGLSPLCFQDSL